MKHLTFNVTMKINEKCRNKCFYNKGFITFWSEFESRNPLLYFQFIGNFNNFNASSQGF